MSESILEGRIRSSLRKKGFVFPKLESNSLLGISDILYLKKGTGELIAVEVKGTRQELLKDTVRTGTQLNFQSRLIENGATAFFVWDEIEEYVDDFLGKGNRRKSCKKMNSLIRDYLFTGNEELLNIVENLFKGGQNVTKSKNRKGSRTAKGSRGASTKK